MTAIEGADQTTANSQLFILRFWLEDMGNGRTDLRGRVQHTNSGEVRYFRDWPTLEDFVEGLLQSTLQGKLSVDPDESLAHK